ncbi:hypothetical protein [Amycolatopsis samaneae]|uniref:GerMN domain-containing protein n=1 Tax=Amycolatopsis samaneae TaxID=664691 RepID=A0ABW5GQA2_9PSEU
MIRRSAVLLGTFGLLMATLTACGVEPSGVLHGGEAPTGVSPTTTLYYLGDQGNLVPDVRRTERLGTVTDALALLMRSSQNTERGLHSAFNTRSADGHSPQVTESDELITVVLPLASYEIGSLGVDQFVCTALGVHRQAGRPADAKVVVTLTTGERLGPRTCPVLR